MAKHMIAKDGKPIKCSKAEAEKLAAQGASYITKDDFKRLTNTQTGAQK